MMTTTPTLVRTPSLITNSRSTLACSISLSMPTLTDGDVLLCLAACFPVSPTPRTRFRRIRQPQEAPSLICCAGTADPAAVGML